MDHGSMDMGDNSTMSDSMGMGSGTGGRPCKSAYTYLQHLTVGLTTQWVCVRCHGSGVALYGVQDLWTTQSS